MRFSGLAAHGLCATSALVSATSFQTRDTLDDLQNQAIAALKQSGSGGVDNTTCSLSNAVVRKDWADLSSDDRKGYISAVKCLMSLPSKFDSSIVPGAKSRYDDFVAQHINQTLTIHLTGNFLSWHRYIVWGYENALREECGYAGYQPYWNWFANQDDLTKSPVFDGSDTSISGDGAFVAHNGSVGGAGVIYIPSGNGGGCLKDGPFKDLIANLGPVSPPVDGETKSNSSLGYNPHCLKRDLSNFTASNWLTTTNLLNLTVGDASASVETFQDELQGRFAQGFLGLHAAGHFTINGDAADLFSSPVDPAFWLHHAMLDRVWWLWQALHPDRAAAVAGTVTMNDNPPSHNTTVDDELYLGPEIAVARPIRDVLDSLGGTPLCYIYM